MRRRLSFAALQAHPSGARVCNPGTVGGPRNAEQRATAIFDTERRTPAVQRVAYDRSRTRAKTRRAGLAPRYWFLPAGARNAIGRVTRAARLHATLKRLGL